MKQKYTQQHIDQFFSRFKELPIAYNIEKVHQLINNPSAKAKYSPTMFFKPLKFLIMTSALIMGLSALMFWQTADELAKPIAHSESEVVLTESEKGIPPVVDKPIEESINNLQKEDLVAIGFQSVEKSQKSPSPKQQQAPPPPSPQIKELCSWRLDTVLNKDDMFVQLSEVEIAKLGLIIKENTFHYKNQPPGSNGYSMANYNWKEENDSATHHKFHLEHQSNINCTTHRWGDSFYNEIDTLVPIIIPFDTDKRVFWFTAHPDLFKALPPRYTKLEAIYRNLKCIKEKNPSHQFVNYWDKNQNIVIEDINALNLSIPELRNLGILIDKDTLAIIDPTKSFQYIRNKYKLECGTYSYNGSIAPEIPELFPAIFTDIKGLKQHTFGSWIKNVDQSLLLNEMLNTLVPVLLPLSEIIPSKKFNLIMWYYPSDNFIDALPLRIREELRSEFNAILKGTTSSESNCNYFEACKSTLDVNDMQIYPNPAKQRLTIDFSLPQSSTGTISLVNISGAQLKVLVPETNFQEGSNTFTTNVADINPGIYMVMIKTENGFKTQRLIVSR